MNKKVRVKRGNFSLQKKIKIDFLNFIRDLLLEKNKDIGSFFKQGIKREVIKYNVNRIV